MLEPLTNNISDQGRIAQPTAEQEQTPAEHVVPSIDITPHD